MVSHNGDADDLPPPPALVAAFEPLKAEETKRQPIKLLTNHFKVYLVNAEEFLKLLTDYFKVSLVNAEEFFYHYYVNLKYEDDTPVDRKGSGRKVIEKLQQAYAAELANKDFAYDGEKSLFTIGALPQAKNEFTFVVEDVSSGKTPANGSPGNESPPGSDRKRVRRTYNTKTYKVELSCVARIPMSAISQALSGQESEHTQEAIRVIGIILRQQSAKQGCLLVRRSFFHNNPNNFVDLGGGVVSCRGFHSSFRATQSGLSLNIDVSTTMLVKPGPVIDFLLANQKVDEPSMIDWAKAKRALKNLRIETSPMNQEWKIVGLSDRPCHEQLFTLKLKNSNNGDSEEITVFDYFVKKRGIKLLYSGDLPCINVGKPKQPTYFPVELCSLLPLQRYTKALSTLQRSSLVEKSRQKPQERMSVLSDVLQRSNYDAEPMLKACGITIARSFTEVDGRILQPPKLKAGNGEDIFTRNGRWNFNNKRFNRASSVENWAVVNFSAQCNVRDLVRDLIKCGGIKGIMVEAPFDVFDEHPSMRWSPAVRRVEVMFKQVINKLPEPKFLLCVLAERKNSDIYGPWKKKCLADEFGIVTQCVAPTRVNDQYLTNVLLKINAKLGGMNWLHQIETSGAIPLVSKVPTIILGMGVWHGSPGQDVPSISAVVSSREWPLISKYRASVRTQSPKMEMINSLFKPREAEDDGLIRECLFDLLVTLLVTLLYWCPGVVVDNKVCHPRNFNFYMCSHAGMIGTTRPTHYHVLHDEIGFNPDDLQELVHSLSYVYQRSTTAISVGKLPRHLYFLLPSAMHIWQLLKFASS